MKKSIFSLLVFAASMAACTGDYTDWADPQQNAQPETVTFANGSVAEVATIQFADVAGDQVKVCNITAPKATAEGFAPIYTINIGGEEYPLTAEGEMPAADLKAIVENNFGKAPVERTVEATVSMWLSNGTEAVKTATSAPFNIKAVLVAPELYPHLYLIGAPSEWSATCTSMPFNHSDASVFDDPVFTITFPVEDGETWFAMADDKTVETNDWSNVFGAKEGNGNNLIGEKGFFTRRSELSDDGSFKVVVEGDAKFVKMTVNVLDGTYLIEKVNFPEYIYAPGNAQGWDPGTAAALKGDGNGLFTGFIVMDGEFKFTQQRAWAAEYNNSHFTTCSDIFSLGDQGGGNISFTGEPGLYYFTVDVAAGNLAAEKVEMMGLIGDFNGWGGDDVMTWNQADLCFEKTGATVTAAGWKFRMNGDWAVNLGGTLDNLEQNGANLDVAGSTIKLYPCRTTSDNIYCTVE